MLSPYFSSASFKGFSASTQSGHQETPYKNNIELELSLSHLKTHFFIFLAGKQNIDDFIRRLEVLHESNEGIVTLNVVFFSHFDDEQGNKILSGLQIR